MVRSDGLGGVESSGLDCTTVVLLLAFYLLELATMSTTTIRLPDDLKHRVAVVAKKAGKSSHAIILDAIALKVAEEECRDDFQETAEKRLAQIAESGKTVPWASMRSYLEDRLSGKQSDHPASRQIDS